MKNVFSRYRGWSALGVLCLASSVVLAQSGSPRLNDKDLERLMENVRHDAKKFNETFKNAVEKSSIRRTSREKDAKKVADRFADQVEAMEKEFDHHKKADSTLPVVWQTMNQLDQMIRDLALEGVVVSDFEKVRTEMSQVAQQFAFIPPS